MQYYVSTVTEESRMQILVNVTEIFEHNSSFNATDTYIGQTYQFANASRTVNIIVRPILIVFGTTGNLLSFYVMRKGSLRKVSTCFYLSILALADTAWYITLFTYSL